MSCGYCTAKANGEYVERDMNQLGKCSLMRFEKYYYIGVRTRCDWCHEPHFETMPAFYCPWCGEKLGGDAE